MTAEEVFLTADRNWLTSLALSPQAPGPVAHSLASHELEMDDGNTQQKNVEANSLGPDVLGPGTVGPGAVDPGAVGPGAVGPGAVGPGAVEIRSERAWLAIRTFVVQSVSRIQRNYEQELHIHAPQESFRTESFRRIWQSWRHFWKLCLELTKSDSSIPTDAESILACLQRQIRPTNSHELGGDPLLDGLLVAGIGEFIPVCLHRVETTFAELFREHGQRWPPHFWPAPLEDVAHDYFVHVCGFDTPDHVGKLYEYNGETSLKAWLRKTTYHHLVDIDRGEKSKLRAFYQKGTLNASSDEQSYEDLSLYKSLIRDHARTALQSLNENEKQAIRLTLQQRSNGEIARLLELSEGATSRLRSRAQKRLIHEFRTASELDPNIDAAYVSQNSASLALAQVLLEQLCELH